MNFSQHTANFLLICLVYRQTLQHFARVSECFLCSGPGTISKVFCFMLQFSAGTGDMTPSMQWCLDLEPNIT